MRQEREQTRLLMVQDSPSRPQAEDGTAGLRWKAADSTQMTPLFLPRQVPAYSGGGSETKKQKKQTEHHVQFMWFISSFFFFFQNYSLEHNE